MERKLIAEVVGISQMIYWDYGYDDTELYYLWDNLYKKWLV